MELLISSLIYFGVSFAVMFLVYILIIYRRKKEYTDGKKQIEINYLVKKFNLDMRKTKYSTLKLVVSLLNSFIIAFVFTVLINLDVKYIWKLLIAFLILMVLIYSLYEIVGRILSKAENKE